MPSVLVRLYAVFAATPAGGNLAGVVYDDAGLTPDQMQQVARDLGAPTTGFVRTIAADAVAVRFFSPRSEMAMCGHVAVGVFVALAEDGRLGEGAAIARRLITAAGELGISVERRSGAVQVTMRQVAPRFDLVEVEAAELAGLLGLATEDLESVGSASTGLRHLLVEVRDLQTLGRLRPDDAGLRLLSRERGLDTVGVYAWLDPAGGVADLRVRDLCHGVGDPEEAASGTTNGALAALLWRRGALRPVQPGGVVRVRAEQGVEMGRPCLVTTELEISGGAIAAVRVGGTATRRMAGIYQLEAAIAAAGPRAGR